MKFSASDGVNFITSYVFKYFHKQTLLYHFVPHRYEKSECQFKISWKQFFVERKDLCFNLQEDYQIIWQCKQSIFNTPNWGKWQAIKSSEKDKINFDCQPTSVIFVLLISRFL